ncbi:methyltransferase [Natronosporangium hydrolyticum]|uniref:methyltransferase n=1 Tax=Natronosporangium hydrolyticum TaxID=2811111 RepID=UPI001EFA1492|nr:methyltransferase [Natronosporangium hydrolyticum]
MEHTSTRSAGPHTSPRTAVLWDVLTAELDRQGAGPLVVIDVGGGTGGFAVPLAEAGHQVTVVDPSPDALAALTRRAADAGVAERVRALQGDGDRLAELVAPGAADMVLCHSLLEVVDEPAEVLRSVAAALRPGGVASVLVANRASALLTRAANGHLAAAAALLDDPDGRVDARDTLRRRFDPATAAALVAGAGLTLEAIHGVRVLYDLIPASLAEADPAALVTLEARLSQQLPYRDIAAQLHLLARRSGER